MELMKAVGLFRYLPIADQDSLVDLELEKPEATGRDILVHVRAVSVNPVDTKVRSPKDKIEDQPKVLGYDASGIVQAVGANCSMFQPGDEVYYAGSVARSGTNSEFHLVDERIVGHKPKSLGFPEAASLPLTTLTAWEALFERMGFSELGNRGETLLIIGAAGGVGSIASQLAKRSGLTVLGTASRPETTAWATTHGCDYTLNHREPLRPQLEAFGWTHVDAILCLHDTVSYWEVMTDLIAPQGVMCSIVETSEKLDLARLMHKSAKFTWEYMFTRALYETEDMARQHEILTHVGTLLDNGEVTATMTECISPINAENLRRVHARLEGGKTIGKIVLEGWA